MDPETERHRPDRNALDYYRRLRRVREHLERNISSALTVTQAARIAGLSPGYFSTYFRVKIGMRFGDWLRLVRVERAKEVLRAGDYSISDVAVRVGYRELRTFERAFKLQTGMTPIEYRRRVRPRGVVERRASGRASEP